MAPFAIVVDLNVFEEADPGRGQRFKDAVVGKQFGLEGAPEGFHRGVVVAVSGLPHAGHDSQRLESLLEVATGILASPIRMKEKPWCREPAS